MKPAQTSEETEAHRLKSRLLLARATAQSSNGKTILVPGVGKNISAAYEQLRNAAEYTEDHLLLQRAARRFYRRNLAFHHRRSVNRLGEELIIELTQAGYLKNGSVSGRVADTVQKLIEQYVEAFWQLRKKRVAIEEATSWTLDILSTNSAARLVPHPQQGVFAYFAYGHYVKLLPKDILAADPVEAVRYDISLYIAVHQALLKSDLATVRADLLQLYRHTPKELGAFIQFNREITELFQSPLTQRLRRAVSKYGGPLRVLKRLIEERPELPEALDDQAVFAALYQQQAFREYKAVRRRLNKGLFKSVVFLLITKAIVGVSLEVPYDLATVGSVALMPLGINLLFPPLYMGSLKLGLRPPSLRNAEALKSYIVTVLYTNDMPLRPSVRFLVRKRSHRTIALYPIVFLAPFGITVFVLMMLHFTVVQMAVFFVFLSTASFLGFRLSQTVRELELESRDLGIVEAIKDFFYLPFVMVGQWLSGKYARVNIIGALLDMLIELPLKTVLRLVRQWLRFLSEQREQIY